MPTRLFAIALLAVCAASPLSSQRLTQRAGLSEPAGPTTAARSQPWSASRDVAPNNWLKGTLIGGGIGFAIGYYIGRPWDRDGSGGTRFLLGTTFLFAVIGGLIGSASKKQ